MFEAAKLGRKVSKQAFKDEVPELRTSLLAAQRELRAQGVPLIILISGVEGAGKGGVVNRLYEWLDSRGVQAHAFWEDTDEERDRPRYWRFWRSLPPKGEIAIMFGGWYLHPIEQRFLQKWDDAELDRELHRIVSLEHSLISGGALIVKFWFHLAEKEQKARLKELARSDRSRWKMLPKKKEFSEHYQRFERMAERLIRASDLGRAPWYLIEAADERYRDLTVGQTLLKAIENRLAASNCQPDNGEVSEPSLPQDPHAQVTLLDRLDLSASIEKKEYEKRLEALQTELNQLTWEAYKQGRSTVLLFEGVDAAGKGGAIRRVTQAVDARLYRTVPIAAPTDEERAHHYLWRFWRHVPRAGRIAIFDRSWYGRVLVERVEGFASHVEWRRSYLEINDFEAEMTESGIVVVKFWLQISAEEQLQRFKARQETPYKEHKITDEDWRNREKWDDYRLAVNEMLQRTSTENAPWTLVAGNDKRFARIKVLETVNAALAKALRHQKPED